MISKRLQDITSFIVMDVLERAHEMERTGIHVIHLEVGEPDFDTPQCVKDAACKAIQDGIFAEYDSALDAELTYRNLVARIPNGVTVSNPTKKTVEVTL